MHDAPENRVLYGSKHLVPGGTERFPRHLPEQPFGPPRQEPAVAVAERAFPVPSGDLFDRHAAGGVVDPPWSVHQEHGNRPQRHELEAAGRHAVVARSRATAPGADRPSIGPWRNVDLERDAALRILHELPFAVHEGLVSSDAIEDRLQ